MNDNSPDVNKERQRRQRGRNIVVFVVLAAFVLLIYAITMVKIGLGYGP